MPHITQLEQIFQYTGEPALIAELPYLVNVRRISRSNASGKGYVSFVPRSAFPPFTWLETGEYYAFSSLTIGYQVPDGEPAAATPAINLSYQVETPFTLPLAG